MRKSAILVGFGAFFLAVALLLKFWAYDRLAVVPLDLNSQQTLDDPNATYFNARTLKFTTGELKTKLTAVADKKASEKQGHNTVVIDKWQVTNDPEGWAGGGQGKWQPQAASQSRLAIDRHTALPVHCCDESIDGTPVSHEGYQIKLPFDVHKDGKYDYWEDHLRKAFPLKYIGEEKVDGLDTYKFQTSTPEGVYTKQDVPGVLFGGAQDSAGVNADRSIQTDATIWVEPVTGVFMKVIQHQQEFVVAPGKSKVKILDTTQTMDRATVKKNVDEYKSKASQLKLVRDPLPWILGILGVLLLLGGIALAFLRRGDRGDDPARGSHHDGGPDPDPENDDTQEFYDDWKH